MFLVSTVEKEKKKKKLEILSVERGIYSIAESTVTELFQ